MPYLNLTGQRFGRLLVIKKMESRNYNSIYLCQCDCGKETEKIATYLTCGDTKSCGCLKSEIFKTHGKSHTNLYSVYRGIKERCYNIKSKEYHNYGGRGIVVCKRWLESFDNFYNDMNATYQKGLSIDRINNNGIYEPSNCRWATYKVQSMNKRFRKDSRFIVFNGMKKTLTQWAKELRIGRSTLRMRLDKYGWSIDKTLTTSGRGDYFAI